MHLLWVCMIACIVVLQPNGAVALARYATRPKTQPGFDTQHTCWRTCYTAHDVCYRDNGQKGSQDLAQTAVRSIHRGPAVNAAPCSTASGCSETALATANQNPNFARKLITYARKLISDISQSDILFGTSSLADDIRASSSQQSYQPDEGSSSNSADAGIIGGLRSPQLPTLSDEGSGMVWNGKGVAPIVK